MEVVDACLGGIFKCVEVELRSLGFWFYIVEL